MTRRTYLVTGATKGIGRALSGQPAAQGHHVIGLARNVDDSGFPGTLYGVDLADEAETARVLDTACRVHAIDGVVNNVAPMYCFGKPAQIAAAVALLLSEDAAFMTGQTLFVDGGASIGRLPV